MEQKPGTHETLYQLLGYVCYSSTGGLQEPIDASMSLLFPLGWLLAVWDPGDFRPFKGGGTQNQGVALSHLLAQPFWAQGWLTFAWSMVILPALAAEGCHVSSLEKAWGTMPADPVSLQ